MNTLRDIETTEDERYIIVDGRRWRATDPNIPPNLKSQLVAELMTARRIVKSARSDNDTVAETLARSRVSNAKHALGERGYPWWEKPTDKQLDVRITKTIYALLNRRALTSSICPSEVARTVGSPDWRSLMEPVRSIAQKLARQGKLRITRKDRELDPDDLGNGHIRLRRGVNFGS